MYGSKQGGLGRYIQQLIKHLEKTDTKHNFVIFLRQENWHEYEPANHNFKKVLADIPWYGWREQLLLPKIIKKEKINLMHFPHWNIPIFYNQPFVVTIHDLLLLHYPTRKASTLSPISYFLKNIAFRFALCHAIKKSKNIITPCKFTKNDILKHFDVPAKKINAVHLGISNFQIDSLPTDKQDSNSTKITKKYSITKPYILYVGVAYPHKNLEGLMRAWKIFEEKYNDNYQLILAGKKNYFYKQLIQDKQLQNKDIIFTDFVPDNELPELYKNASLYAFPSFYEGFGLPPLEAMSYDIPIASSDRSCLPEILQNAAIYFNPEKPEEIAKILHYLLTDIATRDRLITNGRQLIKKYSWDNTAKRTLEIYQDSV